MATPYRWQLRRELVERIREMCTSRGRLCLTSDTLEEMLTDLSRTCSPLAQEAHAAIHYTSDRQWLKLLADTTDAD